MIFFDMDGVIAVHNDDDYFGEHPKYKTKGYFKNRPVDEAVKTLVEFIDDAFTSDFTYLSSITEGLDFEQVSKDKYSWLEKFGLICDGNPKPVFVNGSDKVSAAEDFLGRKLEKTDVLIDDYNPNLKSWSDAGGTAIKYLNGANSSESWDKELQFQLNPYEDPIENSVHFLDVAYLILDKANILK